MLIHLLPFAIRGGHARRLVATGGDRWRPVAAGGGQWQLANDSGGDQQRRRSKAAVGFEPGPVSKEACEDATAQLVP